MINNNPSFDLNTRTLDFENEKVTINMFLVFALMI